MIVPSPAELARIRHYIPTTYRFTSLLTPDGYNPKTKKGRARGYSSAIMHLAPHKSSGIANVCPHASPGCIAGCLHTAGHGGIIKAGESTNEILEARTNRTRALKFDGFEFNRRLVWEVETHDRRATNNGLTPTVRPNGTSDVPWEKRLLNDGRTILETFPYIQFYDYTKSVERALANARGQHPANYHLTFSRSEVNESDCLAVLAAGGNVAVVFNSKVCSRYCVYDLATRKCRTATHNLPDTWHGYRVVDGDHDDLRFLDPRGVVVGLKAKGRAKKDTSGFVVDARADVRALAEASA